MTLECKMRASRGVHKTHALFLAIILCLYNPDFRILMYILFLHMQIIYTYKDVKNNFALHFTVVRDGSKY